MVSEEQMLENIVRHDNNSFGRPHYQEKEFFEAEGRPFLLARHTEDDSFAVYSEDGKDHWFGGPFRGYEQDSIKSIDVKGTRCVNCTLTEQHGPRVIGRRNGTKLLPQKPIIKIENTLFSLEGIFIKYNDDAGINIFEAAEEFARKLENDGTYRSIKNWLRQNPGTLSHFPAEIIEELSNNKTLSVLSKYFGISSHKTIGKLVNLKKRMCKGALYDSREEALLQTRPSNKEYYEVLKELVYITSAIPPKKFLCISDYFKVSSKQLLDKLIDTIIIQRYRDTSDLFPEYSDNAGRHSYRTIQHIIHTWLQLVDALMSTKKDNISIEESSYFVFKACDEESEKTLGRLLEHNKSLKKTEQYSIRELLEWSTLSSPYELIWHLGGGATGKVFLVYDINLDRKRALKLISDPAKINEKEARLLALFEDEPHRNFPKVYAAGEHIAKYDNKTVYSILMEYIEGKHLNEKLEILLEYIGERPREEDKKHSRRHFPFEPANTVIDWSHQLLDAVFHLRSLGVFHRDFRPENILLNKKGVVKILDFGIATTEPAAEPLNNRRYGGPTDFFSLGLIVYKICTGEHLVISRKEEQYKMLTTQSYADLIDELKKEILYKNRGIRSNYRTKIEQTLTHSFIEAGLDEFIIKCLTSNTDYLNRVHEGYQRCKMRIEIRSKLNSMSRDEIQEIM